MTNWRHNMGILSLCISTQTMATSITADNDQAHQAPIKSHFSSPIEGLFHIPAFSNTRILAKQTQQVGLRLEAISNAVSMDNSSESMRFDGETWRLTPSWRFGLGDDWEVHAELPFIRHSSGFLDHSVDEWHELFNFREGSRDDFGRNELVYGYSDASDSDYLLTSSENGIGDLRLTLSKALPTEVAFTAHLHLKAPTGDEDKLMGSDAWDTGLSLSYLKPALFGFDSLSASIELGQHYLGDSDQVSQQENWVSTLHSGLFWHPLHNISFKAQIEGRTGLSDSDLEPIGSEALQGTFGISWSSTSSHQFDLAIVEDLKTDSTSDFTLITEWSTQF